VEISDTLIDLTNDGGVIKQILLEGTPNTKPPEGSEVLLHYTGKFTDGTVFDSSRERSPLRFQLGLEQVIKAWDICVATMNTGEKVKLTCKPEYAYGAEGWHASSNPS